MASLPLPTPSKPPSSPSKPTKSLHFSATHLNKLHKNKENTKHLYTSYFHNISFLCKEGRIKEAAKVLNEMEFENHQIGPEIYGELLQGCVYERALFQGQQIHARILKKGPFFYKNEYIETKLVIFYAKCDSLTAASDLFFRLYRQNVFSWAAMIGLHCREGLNEKALLGFCEMQKNGFFPDNYVVPNVLKACSALQWIGFGRGVHGYVLKMGFGACVFVASSLVDMYGKCGLLGDARKVFDEIPERNVVAWNSMIVSYVQNGLNEEAMDIFYDMRVEGVEPTRVTVSSFLSASANLEATGEGRQGHSLAVLYGLELDNILGSSLMNFYSKVGLMEDAELVFSRMVERDVVTWNLLISGYVQDGQIERALYMCRRMRSETLRFDSVTLTSVFSACSDSCDLELGKEGHGYSIRNNLVSDLVVVSSIIDMYAKCERIDDARRVFDSATQGDLVMWNTLIAAYAQFGLSGEALKLFYQMQLEGVPPNVVSWNSVILGFLRNGQVDEAKDMFSQMQSTGVQPNIVSWTTLISGLAQNGYEDEAILLFQQMQLAGYRPNTVSVVSVLEACTNLASLQYGKAIHAHVIRHELCPPLSVVPSLVDMYAKCGDIYLAEKIFEVMYRKELPSYNAMIFAFALHGQATKALALFNQMQKEGMEFDDITFTGVLSACSHAGLVDEGLKVFTHMLSIYHVKPSMEHYGCVVDLLCRSGDLGEALKFVAAMPFEPDAPILGSLLGACTDQHEIELGKYLSQHLYQLEPENLGNYVTLSNTYAATGRWAEVSKLRDLMKEKGMRKNPGCSWIQIGREIHAFVVGDRSHPQTEVIYETLTWVEREMRFIGYAQFNNTEQNNFRQEIPCS
ncbi:tetratricopeptide repeat (TPR)-like superfamily protein [Tasmannia lanceolata]|uniref:tetratricopeptide repeat (TPR)-like superfamily protein n=1 Tax=Tasmannia lanceolata TaxID=3420 RepID=UPI004063280E